MGPGRRNRVCGYPSMGIDGRVARGMLKGTIAILGAELDSLGGPSSNFGVAPALILYFWGPARTRSCGLDRPPWWLCDQARVLRLARFNTMIDDPNRPAWAGNFFVGMPAPGCAHPTSLLPIYLFSFWVFPRAQRSSPMPTFVYTLANRVPDGISRAACYFPGKRHGKRVFAGNWCCRDFCGPLFCSLRCSSPIRGSF